MKRFFRNIRAAIFSIIVALFVVFILKTFIGMPTTITGTSMFPTLASGEKVFLSTWSATFNKTPKRGDCITFDAPSVDLIDVSNSSKPVAIYKDTKSLWEKFIYYGLGMTKSSYVKRVIGIPGDHVEIKEGSVYVNGEKLKDEYVSQAITTDMAHGGNCSDVIVPEGHVYVLGDNRISSADSRRFGCIPIDKIEGKIWFRWWPISRFGKV